MTDVTARIPPPFTSINSKTTAMKNAQPEPANQMKQNQQPASTSARACEGSVPEQASQTSNNEGKSHMKTSFIGLARVARIEGNNLEVQEVRIREYSEANGYPLTKIHMIVEAASESSARPLFWKAIKEAMESANELAGILFCTYDRVARNMKDMDRLYRLAREHGLAIEFTENGLALKGSEVFSNGGPRAVEIGIVEPRASRIVRGLVCRAQLGLFVGRAPYAYENINHGNSSYTETDPAQARAVKRAFELIDEQACLPEKLGDALLAEGLHRTQKKPRFTRSQLWALLRNRAYLGEVNYLGKTYEGSYEPIVDEDLFNRVQVVLDRAEG